jgi:hypothetical protein
VAGTPPATVGTPPGDSRALRPRRGALRPQTPLVRTPPPEPSPPRAGTPPAPAGTPPAGTRAPRPQTQLQALRPRGASGAALRPSRPLVGTPPAVAGTPPAGPGSRHCPPRHFEVGTQPPGALPRNQGKSESVSRKWAEFSPVPYHPPCGRSAPARALRGGHSALRPTPRVAGTPPAVVGTPSGDSRALRPRRGALRPQTPLVRTPPPEPSPSRAGTPPAPAGTPPAGTRQRPSSRHSVPAAPRARHSALRRPLVDTPPAVAGVALRPRAPAVGTAPPRHFEVGTQPPGALPRNQGKARVCRASGPSSAQFRTTPRCGHSAPARALRGGALGTPPARPARGHSAPGALRTRRHSAAGTPPQHPGTPPEDPGLGHSAPVPRKWADFSPLEGEMKSAHLRGRRQRAPGTPRRQALRPHSRALRPKTPPVGTPPRALGAPLATASTPPAVVGTPPADSFCWLRALRPPPPARLGRPGAGTPPACPARGHSAPGALRTRRHSAAGTPPQHPGTPPEDRQFEALRPCPPQADFSTPYTDQIKSADSRMDILD